jgi:MOB kinase activator 1
MEQNNYPGYKPKKKIEKTNRGYGLKQIAKMTLGSGNLEIAVELPDGEDLNEWLAVNTIEFYNDSIFNFKFSKPSIRNAC